MKTLLLIFCYGGDNERIERHYPFWHRSAGDNIWFVCPEDSPVSGVETVLAHGKSQQFGPELIKRMLYGMNLALGLSDADAFLVTEADCVTVGTIPDHPKDGFRCVIYANGDPAWKASSYIHTPWWFDRPTMDAVVRAMSALAPDAELGFPDRHVAWACEQARITPIRDNRLVSHNQFDLPRYMEDARRSIAKGAFALHGVKTEAQLKQLLA